MIPAAAELDDLPVSARACVEELGELERAKAALAARQARVAARLDDLDPRSSERGTGAQVGLARRESPHRGRRLLGLARGLVDHHPMVLAMLAVGEINERRAELIVTETQDLEEHDRRTADQMIAGLLCDRGGSWGDRSLQDETRRVVQRIDAAGALRRREKAHARRHVFTRSFGDGTAQVSGTIADYQMVAIMTSLEERAQAMIARGDDERSRSQIIADLFVERLTGQVTATSVPVSIEVVMPVETLLGDADEPAEVAGRCRDWGRSPPSWPVGWCRPLPRRRPASVGSSPTPSTSWRWSRSALASRGC